jgi:hypothetical protein
MRQAPRIAAVDTLAPEKYPNSHRRGGHRERFFASLSATGQGTGDIDWEVPWIAARFSAV